MSRQPSTSDLLKYYRQESLPTIWCPGCGLGIVMRSLVSAIHESGIDPDKVVIVSGIGCSGRMSGYMNFSSVHTTHGRALAFATGIKMANPDLHVVVIMGDGDASAIGGNHLIHAARRNIGVTALVANNSTYGMTGGQYSPTTPVGAKSTTSVKGNIETGFDLIDLVSAAGASFTARGAVAYPTQLTSTIQKAIEWEGFSFVEAVTHCPTCFGRKNSLKTPGDMLRAQKEATISFAKAKLLKPHEIGGRIVTGVHFMEKRPEYTTLYEEQIREPSMAEQGGASIFGQTTQDVAAPAVQEYSESATVHGDRIGIRIGGTGGQGVITAGVMLAEVAMAAGFNVVQGQVYGPEARGGASRCEVLMSKAPIFYPEVTTADLMVLLSQQAADKYIASAGPMGYVLYDPAKVKTPQALPGRTILPVDFTRIAKELAGVEMAANVVALGASAVLLGLTDEACIRKVIGQRVPKKVVDANIEAALEGMNAMLAALSGSFEGSADLG